MLEDPKEIAIISAARQKNIRDPKRSRTHFVNIFADFMSGVDFHGSAVIDLGPGQYDFSVLAIERGAMVVAAIDNDPAVVALGRHRGYQVKEASLRTLDPTWFETAFDGVFCKFSLNCFWFIDDSQKLIEHIDNIASLMRRDAWAWIAPWNGLPKTASLTDTDAHRLLDIQKQSFEKHGFRTMDLSQAQAAKYGVTGAVLNNRIFLKNL